MKNRIVNILVILLLGIAELSSQANVHAVRVSAHNGYTILSENGRIICQLPRYAEPIFDGIIRSGSYPDVLSIPIIEGNYPIRYLEDFYLIDTIGAVINRLHEDTEWVHPFQNNISRVSLFKEGNPRLFQDMYINPKGENPFGNKIFKDGNDFQDGNAAVQDAEDGKWKVIGSSGNEILNISDKFGKEINVVNNSHRNIWKINFKDHSSTYISKTGSISEALAKNTNFINEEYQLNPKLLRRLKSYQLKNYNKKGVNHFILYDTIPNSFKIYPVIYSDQYETRYLIEPITQDTLTPYRAIGNSIVAKSDNKYYIYNRSNLQLIVCSDKRPYEITDKLILSNSRVNDYYNENVVLNFDNLVVFNSRDYHKIHINTDPTELHKDEIKELVLVTPTETELLGINSFKNLEVITLVNLKSKELPWKQINHLENLEVLNLIRCNSLSIEELNKEHNKIKFLNINGGKFLKTFRPEKDKWTLLQMYSKGILRYTTENKEELTIGNMLR